MRRGDTGRLSFYETVLPGKGTAKGGVRLGGLLVDANGLAACGLGLAVASEADQRAPEADVRAGQLRVEAECLLVGRFGFGVEAPPAQLISLVCAYDRLGPGVRLFPARTR